MVGPGWDGSWPGMDHGRIMARDGSWPTSWPRVRQWPVSMAQGTAMARLHGPNRQMARYMARIVKWPVTWPVVQGP